MQAGQTQTIIAVNSGSSSLKFGLFTASEPLQSLLNGTISGIGTWQSSFEVSTTGEDDTPGDFHGIDSVGSAAEILADWLLQRCAKYNLVGIGHRVVHGGLRLKEPELVSREIIRQLENLVPLAPLHLPASLTIIDVFRKSFPGVVQVACFDTAFHAKMPFEARHYAIPRSFWDEGITRYGFHGISCEYIYQQLQSYDERLISKRIIIAHLGAGSSITAIKNGHSIENTMGFTPAGGLVMNTRAGDIDPGVISYLLKERKMNATQVDELFTKHAGLLAVSGSDHSMKQLLEEEDSNPKARQAILLYCYHVKKQIGALAATLGGLDILVFTGGIGEHSPVIRQRCCEGLEFIGIELNKDLNENSSETIHELPARVQVYVIPANEEIIIAQHVKQNLVQHK